MLILNKDHILETVSFLDILQVVEEALERQELGNYLMPDRMHVEDGDNVFLLMPAYADQYFSTKLVSVFPGNSKHQLPSTQAAIVLMDGKSGKILSLLDGTLVTGLRTGAVGALGIAYTTPVEISRVGIIGAGFQGFHQLLFAAAVRNLAEVNVYDPSLKDENVFRQQLQKYLPHLPVHFQPDSRKVIENSEAIITATTSMDPVLPDEESLLRDKHFIGIGSFKPAMREYPDAIFRCIDRVCIDTDLAREESGDIRIPLEKNLIESDQVIRLGQLITNQLPIEVSRTTFFKSVGMALFDLFAARLIYETALEKGKGLQVEL
ncbi:MAG: ornithine cyclodeaminase family protein [bacterium]